MKKVSILTVGRNEANNLPRLYDSMKKLSYPKKDYEVVYVDDASTDGSAETAKRYGARVARAKTRKGRGGIRNFALKQARYPTVAWIDADCEIVDKDWLQNMLVHLKGSVVGVSGHQLRPKNGLPRLISYLPGMMVEVSRVSKAPWAPTTSSMFVKEPLMEEGYRNDLVTAEDLEVCWRLSQKGYTFVQTPRAQIVHHFRATLKGFWKQQWERGVFGAALKSMSQRTPFDKAVNNIHIIFAAGLASVIVWPWLRLPALIAPAVLCAGLDGVTPITSVTSRYVRVEKKVRGIPALIALNYVKNVALLGGMLQYKLLGKRVLITT